MSRLVLCAFFAVVLASCGGGSSGGDLEDAEQEVEAAVETTTSSTTTTTPDKDDSEAPGPALDPAIVAAFEAVISADEATIQQAIEQFSQDGRKKAIAISGAALFYSTISEICGSLDDGDQRVVYTAQPDCVDLDYERWYPEIAGEPGGISDFSYSRSYQVEDSGELVTQDASFYEIGFRVEGVLATMPFPLMAHVATTEARARTLADVLLVDEFVAYDFGPDASRCFVTLVLRNADEDKDLNLRNPRLWEYYDFIGSELPEDYATSSSLTDDVRIRAGRVRLYPFVLEAPCGELYEVSVEGIEFSELDGSWMYGLVEDEIFTLEVRAID